MTKNYGWIRSVHARAIAVTVHPFVLNLLPFASLFSEADFQLRAKSVFTQYRAIQIGCFVALVLNVLFLGFLATSLSPLLRVVFFIVLGAIAVGLFTAIRRRQSVLEEYLRPVDEQEVMSSVQRVRDTLEKDNALRYVDTVRSYRTFCKFDTILLACAALSPSNPMDASALRPQAQ